MDKLISILTIELRTEMKLVGVTSLAEINSTIVGVTVI